MSQVTAKSRAGGELRRRLEEVDMFFRGRGRVQQTIRRLARRLEAAKIPYGIVGGMAVNAHHHERTTRNVDFLLTAEGLAAMRQLAGSGEFDPVPGRLRRFLDRNTKVTIDILIAGHFHGSGQPGPIRFPDPSSVAHSVDRLRFVDLRTLVELKLAARRYQDFADVVNLIRANGLDESFAANPHPAVRTDYIECLEEKRREDEYEARQDRAAE